MKTFRDLLYISFGVVYFYGVYVYFGSQNVLDALHNIYVNDFVLSLCSWIVAFFTLLWALSLLEKVIRDLFEKIVANTENDFDDMIFEIVMSLVHNIKYLLTLYLSWQLLIVPESLDLMVDQGFSIALLILLLLMITKCINLLFQQKLIENSRMKSVSKALLPFVQKIIIALVWIVGIITVISNLWYDVTALIAGAWVWGIAVALAAQKSVANIFGAITILMNKPFTLGDYVTINGHTWTVKDIGLSYITMVDRNGHNVMIPNENIISSSIENQTRRNYRRADFAIGLIYDTTLTQMQKWVKIIEEILQKYVEEKKLQSFRVNFETFGDFSLNINVTYFSGTKNYTEFVKEKEEINLEIKKLFTKSKLEMAFPTQEMIIKGGDIK